MNQFEIIVEENLCVGCGLCEGQCITGNIRVDGQASAGHSVCMGCGHCYAVCPQGAIKIKGYGDFAEEPQPSTHVSPEAMLTEIKSRRTVRSFKKREIEPEVFAKLMDAARFCPTACNYQNTEFIVLKDRREEMESLAIDILRELQKSPETSNEFMRSQKFTDHFLFKQAPLVLLVANNHPNDWGLAASYIELMASTLGLGVLYSGFFMRAWRASEELRSMVELKPGFDISECMVIGYPDEEFLRIPPRFPAKVREV